MNDLTTLGEQFRAQRISKKISQNDLAQRVNLRRKQTICEIEKGRYNASIDLIQRLAEALDVELSVTLISRN